MNTAMIRGAEINANAQGKGMDVLCGRPCFVRVTGTLAGRFVEFEFSIGDPEMAVELVLLFDQFKSFCELHRVTHLAADEAARLDWERMKWRYGAPGIDH